MEIPYRIRTAAERLKAGRRSNRITVRDFLGLSGAERRGASKVQEIRTVLDALDLQTEPDFETEWIDAPIWLKLKEGVALISAHTDTTDDEDGNLDLAVDDVLAVDDAADGASAPPGPAQASPHVERTGEAFEILSNIEVLEGILSEDPTYRIGKLPAANNKNLITVSPNDPVMKAITLMLQYDLSQLPIMQTDREVKGMITWKSICSFECMLRILKSVYGETTIRVGIFSK